jgi:hypothetical protein
MFAAVPAAAKRLAVADRFAVAHRLAVAGTATKNIRGRAGRG